VANLIVSAVSTFDNKGLKKGKKEISAFDKQVSQLGKTFAGVFGAQALFNYGKNAVKAFMADEKAAKSLELQLKNTGNAFAAPSVEYYIANLQKVTGVLDDELRPAFQQLLTSSGSITLSQEALNTALDISAATGKSLTEVSAALSRGFAGNTTGLSRLGAGLSKATLKTGSMEKILAELNQKFSGQAAARLDTYAGKMDLLTVSTENFKEEIGRGLLDALSALGKDKNIESATSQMDALGASIGDAIYGAGLLISKLDGLVNKVSGGGLKDLIKILQPGFLLGEKGFEFLSSTGANERMKSSSNFTYSLGSSATKDIERVKEITRLKTSNKLRQDEINKMKAKSGVDKLAEKFDTDRIGLEKALNETTDAETKLRLQSKLAILDNNEALAKKYLAELNAAKSATDLASAFNGATVDLKAAGVTLDGLKNSLPGLLEKIRAGAATFDRGSSAATSPVNTPVDLKTVGVTLDRLQTTLPTLLERVRAGAATFDRGTGQYSLPSGMPSSASTSAATTQQPIINVNVEGSLTSLQQFETTIQDLLLKIYKQNGDLAPAGFIQ
jgi:hypothetical protein